MPADSEDLKIGTLGWWRHEHIHGFRGTRHVIVEMVVQALISPRKGVELLDELDHRREAVEVPPAPWDEFTWSGPDEPEEAQMRPLVEAFAAYPCPTPKGRYLPVCTNPQCESVGYGGHRHFGDVRDCGECAICRAKALVRVKL